MFPGRCMYLAGTCQPKQSAMFGPPNAIRARRLDLVAEAARYSREVMSTGLRRPAVNGSRGLIIAALDAGVPLRDVRVPARRRGRRPADRHVRLKLAFREYRVGLPHRPPADRDRSVTAISPGLVEDT
jgi:hypothetical protein